MNHAAMQPQNKARVTAAVLSLDGGSRKPLLYGQDALYDTATIIKVDILAALLLQAQDAGRHPTTHERALAEPMIRNSDNAGANGHGGRFTGGTCKQPDYVAARAAGSVTST
ncbi:hypothetical protein [Streptomyces sp. B21-097]|uniref:hypothetical protein n=1 Tax=Streptomyces sp. B21-097 TaxID=3039414 RepID=UPI003FA7E6E2